MAGLKGCLEKIGLESHERAIINGAVRGYQGEGYPEWEAATIAVRDYIKRLEAERRDIERQIAAESAKGKVRASAKEGAIGPPKGARRSVFSQSRLWSPEARRRVEDRILRDALTNDAFFEMVGERRVPPLDLDRDAVDDYIAEAFPEWADEIEYVYAGVERPDREDFETADEYREALADYEDLSGWAAKAYRDAVDAIRRNVEARYQEHAKRILKKLRALEEEFEEVPKDLLASIRAFHGSPHRFSRFDLGKIGTGEGSQVFGWGLYFSDEKEVARHYAGQGDPGAAGRWSFDNVDWSSPEIDAKERAGLLVLLTEGRAKIDRGEWKTVKDARNDYETQLRVMERNWDRYREIVGEGEAEYRRDAARAALAYLDNHPEARILEPKDGGQYVYRVVIHNGKSPDQYDYLDWHEPPTKGQIEKLRNRVMQAYSEGNPFRRGLLNILEEVERSLGKPNAKMRLRGADLYSDLSFELGFRTRMADKEASLLLLAAGIDGIKYRAGSLFGQEGGYSRNYVVFDDSEVAIEALEDLQGRAVELAASAKQLGLFGEETEPKRKKEAKKKAEQMGLGLEMPEPEAADALELKGERAGAKEAYRAKKLLETFSVKQIPERFATTNEALAFGRYATPEQIRALRGLYEESKGRASALLKQKKYDEAMAEAAKGQFFREAIDAAEGRIDLAKWADPVVSEENTKLVDPEPAKFSFKEAPLLRPLGPVQAKLFPEAPRPAAAAKKPATKPGAPAVPPAPEAEVARIRAEIAPSAPPPKPGEAPGKIVPFTRVRMETTGSIAAAGNVVRDVGDAAALLAPIRKSAQEMAFTIAVAADGTVLEIHRYSRGSATGATLIPSDIMGRIFNTPGAARAYFFHNHPGGTTSPSAEDLSVIRMLRALGNMAKMPVSSGIIAGTRFVEIDEQGEVQSARPIRPTVRKTKLPIRERYLVQSARKAGPINNSAVLKKYLSDQFPGKQGILFLDARLNASGFMPWPDMAKPARAAVEVLKAREFVNAATTAIVLDHDATAQEKDFIVNIQELTAESLRIIEVLQAGESSADAGTLDKFRSHKLVEPAALVEQTARLLTKEEYQKGSLEDEARFSVRAEADRRFAAGIRDWQKLRPTQSVRLDYTPDVLRMLGAEDLPIEIDQETIQKVLEPSRVAGGKHGRIGVQELMDLPLYLNRPIMVFDSKTVPGALVVMTEIVDADGDTAVAAIHLSKRKGHRVVNNIASVYGKNDEQFFLREIKAGRLRYIDEKKSRRWAEKRKISLPSTTEVSAPGAIIRALIALRGKDPGAFRNIVLTEKDLVKFVREGRFSLKPRQADIDSPAFKRWFGNSKVVDKDGKPLVVYHGTTRDFTAFERMPGEVEDIGFHFGTRYQAEARLENRAQMLGEGYEGAQVVPAYLSIQNPLRLPDAGNWTASMIAAMIEMKGAPDLTKAQRQHVVKIGYSGEKNNTAKLRDYLKSLGYDGIVYKNKHEGAGESWIAFDPTQIKSAIGNVGTFDSENPDIRFSLKRLSPEAQDYIEMLRAAEVNIGKPAPSKKDLEADPFEGLPDDVKARLQAAKGVPKPGLLDRAKVMGVDVWHSLTRHRPYLDPKADATIADILRTHQDTPRNSVRRALQVLQAIAGGLRPKQYEAFSMTLVMRDMIRDLESGLLTGKEGLPFGFDEGTARSYLEHLERVSAADPAVDAALRKRDAFDRKLKKALVAAELLPEAVLKDQAYFHHQVLKYQALKALGGQYQGLGVGPTQDVRLRKKGWQIARTGSIEDYNTQYVQAEFEVIAQALAQLETRDVMRQVAGRADISESLRQKATRMNYIAVVGGEGNYERLLALRADAARIRELAQGKPDSEERKLLKEIAEKIWEIDPTMPFRQRMAIGMQKLAKALGLDQDIEPDEDAFDEELMSLRKLAEYAKSDDEAVSIPARMVFKAMAEREKFIRETLGRNYATAERIIPDGYVEWLPKPGGSWYRAYSIPDRVASQVLAGEVVLGAENAEKIRQVLARGKPETWIIPEGLAKTLDGYDAKFDDHMLAKVSRTLMDAWKKWTLINPFRVIRYNLNNLSGDLDIAFAYEPRILTHYLAGAIRDLWGDYRGKAIKPALKAEIDLANRLGVLDSGWSVQEVWDVAKELSLKEHMLALAGEKPHLIARGWKGLENFTRYRENWARLAAFRYFRDAIARGENVYGASNPAEVYGIEDPDRKAAKLARELIGDYGNLTHAGQFIRRHLIPFYAWMEINAPRYVRLMRNLKHEGRGGEARLVAMFGKNIAWKATKLGAKAAFLMVMVNLWNHTFFPDEEDELGEEQRRQMHLILGRRKDGSIISLRFQGALSDALSWFGAEDVIEDIRKIRKGTAAIADIAKDSALAGPIKIINALRPDVKVLGEVIGGRAWYPDPFNPKPIRDKLQHVARTFSAGSLYDWAAGKPKRGGTVGERLANDLLALGFYTSDPGETAYYDIVKRVSDWREKAGKESPAIVPTDKANALYYYKQALKFGDIGAAERYLKRYYELGGTERGLGQSIKRAHPLGMIAKKDHGEFLKTLSPEEMERYRIALRWYQETYREAAEEVKALAGREAAGRKKEEAAEVSGGMTLRDAVQLMK